MCCLQFFPFSSRLVCPFGIYCDYPKILNLFLWNFHWMCGLHWVEWTLIVLVQAFICGASIPNGHWFMAWLLHLWFSTLLTGFGKQQRTVKVLGLLHPSRRPKWGPWLPALERPSSGHGRHLGSEARHGKSLPFSLSLLLSAFFFLILTFN